MVNFPVFDRLDIEGYSLFPGDQKHDPGLHVLFRPGLTLVLGANGLGKTTLVTILYRMLVGPFDIPGLSGKADLGSISLQPTNLPPTGRAIFGQRVWDGARNATARLAFSLGRSTILVERRLRDLSLAGFSVDGQEFTTTDESAYQREIPRLVDVWSFGDWILLLRHLIFYFEDRRSLVWDASAQRQILRLLLLPTETAQKWTQAERSILELDSRSRNLSATLFREERALAYTEIGIAQGTDIKAELKTLEDLQQIDLETKERLDDSLVELDALREAARRRWLKAEQERESRSRDVEHAKLTAIEARFPQQSDTARYIIAHLMTEADCLVCGNHVPSTAAALERRVVAQQCVICGSDVSYSEEHVPASTVADRRVERASADLAEIEPEVAEAQQQLEETGKKHDAVIAEISRLNAEISQRSARVSELVRRLPPDEAKIRQQQTELGAMRSSLEIMRRELSEQRQAFGTFVDEEIRNMVARSSEIITAFGHYAAGFLIEKCGLIWSPQRARVGQSGDLIEFPAFELEMTGAGFPSPVRRSGPEQVSESQREFIDLAFRMSLMEVIGTTGTGSLVIDAPESSLDAVFVTRAAAVLARFAAPNRKNRLIITSNLIEGRLIPSLLRQTSTPDDRLKRVVNLFNIALPTAAIREHRSEYDDFLANMLATVDDAPQTTPEPREGAANANSDGE